jgi:hypothetical protein
MDCNVPFEWVEDGGSCPYLTAEWKCTNPGMCTEDFEFKGSADDEDPAELLKRATDREKNTGKKPKTYIETLEERGIDPMRGLRLGGSFAAKILFGEEEGK